MPNWTANISTGWIITVIAVLAIIRISLWRVQTARGSSTAAIKWFTEFTESALIAFVLVFGIIRPFVIQAFYIPSGSMRPTLMVRDRILVNKFIYRFHSPRRGDIVVFKAPPQALMDSGDTTEKDYIKRVIGLPGDTVEVRQGYVFINGKPLTDESYILSPPEYYKEPTKVPQGQYFVMGDNRNDSNDSHRWGTLEGKRVLGKAMLIFWPIDRVRLLK